MKCTVTGLSVETKGMTEEQLEQAKIFSGKNAGICYMGESYFDSNVTDPAKALPRFISTANNAHHSISDHVQIEVLLENCSKMLAIVLNSLQNYATSEKSGRYTVMSGNSERENELYNKWLSIFKSRILEIKPDVDDEMLMKLCAKKGHDDIIVSNGQLANDNMADMDSEHQRILKECKVNKTLPSTKLAQENARYVLSVFTRSTTMGYSTSLRQWNYIYDWCKKYMSAYKDNDGVLTKVEDSCEASYFEKELYNDFKELSDYIYSTMYVAELRDTKDRCFDFLTQYSGVGSSHPMTRYDLSVFEPNPYSDKYDYAEDVHSEDDKIGFMYNISYTASFAQIAQAERHRTLKYYMMCNFGIPHLDFFVPPMIRGTDYEQEWLADLTSVADILPQATKVVIIETGDIANFVLKCKERLCGRAQWEIMHQTTLTAKRFIKALQADELESFAKPYAEELCSSVTGVTTKCQLCHGCKESCMFGAKEALTRLF